MTTTYDLLVTVLQDRERAIRGDRLARLAACARACCSTSLATRLARALRLAPTSC
jgi:hypothetical protein